MAAVSRWRKPLAKCTMRRRNLLLSALRLLCGTHLLGVEVSRAQNTDPLRSFYAVTNFFSDYLPGWYEEILEVTPQRRISASA